MKTFLFLVLLFSEQIFAEKVVLLTQERPPFTYHVKGVPTGVGYDMVSCVLDKMKVDYEIRFVPWKRAQYQVEKGKASGFFAGSKNSRRDNYAIMSNPFIKQSWTWYYLKDAEFKPGHPRFQKTANVASYLGANMQKHLEGRGYNIPIVPKGPNELIEVFKLGRLDAFMFNDRSIDSLFGEWPNKHLVKKSVYRSKPLGVYFNKNFVLRNPKFLPSFNINLKSCYFNKYSELHLKN